MEEKENLINNINLIKKQLLPYIYPDFPKAKLFARQYHDTIISNVFNNSKTTSSVIYGDVNKLSELNKIGKSYADRALYQLFIDIRKALPNKASFSRIGGDEISITIPNSNLSEAKQIEQKLKNLYNILTISLASADSSSQLPLKELEKLAESNVDSQKHKRKNEKSKAEAYSDELLPLKIPSNATNSEKEKWKILNNYINTAIDNHLSDIRLSDNSEYASNNIKNEAMNLITAFSKRLKQSFLNDLPNSQESLLPYRFMQNYMKDTHINPVLEDKKTCNLIHDLISDNTSFDIHNLSTNDLTNLQQGLQELLTNTLTKNNSSNLLNKACFNHYLTDKILKSNSNYQTLFFSISGIKVSNTACGHDYTDMRIKETSKILTDSFSKHCKFNNTPFTFNDSDNFLIDRGGGNFLALISNENKLSKETILKTVNSVNSCYNSNDISSPFKITYACSDDFLENGLINKTSRDTFTKDIYHLKKECNNHKDKFKKDETTDITNLLAFEKRISNATTFFRKNICTGPNDIENQKIFIENLFTSLVNNEYYHNKYEKTEGNDTSTTYESISF